MPRRARRHTAPLCAAAPYLYLMTLLTRWRWRNHTFIRRVRVRCSMARLLATRQRAVATTAACCGVTPRYNNTVTATT